MCEHENSTYVIRYFRCGMPLVRESVMFKSMHVRKVYFPKYRVMRQISSIFLSKLYGSSHVFYFKMHRNMLHRNNLFFTRGLPSNILNFSNFFIYKNTAIFSGSLILLNRSPHMSNLTIKRAATLCWL